MIDLATRNDYIFTFTGQVVTPLDPDPASIKIEDIAHSLANQCRFTGHTKKFYSVAQHSFLASQIVPAEDALWGLLHDATEAYLADIARPIKRQPGLGEVYREAEEKLRLVVAEAFNLPPSLPESVIEADVKLLRAEMRDLMPANIMDPLFGGEAYIHRIIPWAPERARWEFIARYWECS